MKKIMLIILAAAGFAFCAEDFTCNEISYTNHHDSVESRFTIKTSASYFNDSLVATVSSDGWVKGYTGKKEGRYEMKTTAIISSVKSRVILMEVPVTVEQRIFSTTVDGNVFYYIYTDYDFRAKVDSGIISLARRNDSAATEEWIEDSKREVEEGDIVGYYYEEDDGIDCIEITYVTKRDKNFDPLWKRVK